MPLSPKVLRGLNVKGWKTYEPRVVEEKMPGDDHGGNDLAAEQSAPPPSREAIEREHKEILAAARKEGEQLRREMLAKGEKEAAALRKEAEQKGYREGLSRGEQEAAKLKEDAARTLEEAKEEHRSMLDGAEGDMLSIAVSMAEKLLNVQVTMSEDVILAVITRCLKALPGGHEVVLRVSPRDESLCRLHAQALQALLRKDVSLQIIGDESIPAGGCAVESEEAEITFHLEKELEILIKKLLTLTNGRYLPGLS